MKKLTYVLLLMLSFSNLFSQTYPTLSFRKPTTSDNKTWKFTSVTSGVDAYITNVRSRNATLSSIDDSSRYVRAWNPFIRYTNQPSSASDSSYIEFKIEFKRSNGTPYTMPAVAMAVVDCDGGRNGINIYREMVKSTGSPTPTGLLGTLITSVAGGPWVTNVSGTVDYGTLDTSNFLAMTQLSYTNVSSYTLKVGVIGRVAAGTVRQSSFYFKNFAPLTIVLPVKLINFNAVDVNSVNTVKWSTASEENANRFEVYRSLDGVNFTLAGTVKATGYSQALKNYTFADAQTAGEAYYRLRMIDNDEQYTWSNTVKISKVQIAEKTQLGSVYPNPTKGLIHVDFKSVADSEFTVQVVDIFGKAVRSFENSDLDETRSLSIDLSDIDNGVYFIKVNNNDGSSSLSKFIKN